MKKAVSWLLRPAPMGVLGLATGFLVKMLDIHCYAQHFGVSLSDICLWIATAASLYSGAVYFLQLKDIVMETM